MNHLRLSKRIVFPAVFVLSIVGIVVAVFTAGEPGGPSSEDHVEATFKPRVFGDPRVALWWGDIPQEVREQALPTAAVSNIMPSDYVGPHTCKKCHEKNYESWSEHPHRWMNALADESTVKGDFSGSATISYLGGRAEFARDGDAFRMRLERDGIRRTYHITQTIGSRFYQYYVGKMLEGPESVGHRAYQVDHVLPFGYWLDRRQWVPTVHVHWVHWQGKQVDEEELPDGHRTDPFAPPHDDFPFTPYHLCNQCHTTFPLGDMLIRRREQLARHNPAGLHLAMSDYLAAAHPDLLESVAPVAETSNAQIQGLLQTALEFEASGRAVSLGISCEACHLGGRQHAEGQLTRPHFYPSGAHVCVVADDPQRSFGRSRENVTWACSRCHTGGRPTLAGGMSTWNSTEADDMLRGACTSQITCIDCHNPHEAIGREWTQTPQRDDASCLTCHEQFELAASRRAHTHHATDSAGSRCMNCHMPRLNEGMQDVVRTHLIHSPTLPAMIESNQPNACNLCHLEKSIDWTLEYLTQWYGAKFSSAKIERAYANRNEAVGLGWLSSDNKSVRLIAADALARSKAEWALPELIDALDDPHLLNRQFAQSGLEKMLGIRLSDHGYTYYQTPDERRQPLAQIRERLLSNSQSASIGPAQ